MSDPVRILGIPGSLRQGSYNRLALEAAKSLVPEGATLEIHPIDGLPVYNQDLEVSAPEAVLRLKDAVRAADAILFATPEHNYSIPAALKNAIDWASRPYGQAAWTAKPAAIMGASTGLLGTARAQYHLRQVLVFFDMPVVAQPEVMIGSAAQRFDAQGRLTDDKTREKIAQLLAKLVTLTRTLRSGA
ncbi:NADPH-dependent FMN reductase [Caldimonas tepidiphila]|uniref:NADPH-dependent FMN reductase n=1 Tax=Caldimonas tepidiphila TaxID=2315841 RepID=UPI000E5A314D|nr:NAD(P)H-dependent oxidoreductase [Caldimonas tepidiphila]